MATDSERLARLEGIVDTLSQRVSDMDTTHTSEFSQLRQDIDSVRTDLRQDIDSVRTDLRRDIEGLRLAIQQLDSKFWRLAGFLGLMWVTIILAILFAP